MFMVFNATFNNFSVISWRSVLFVEETGVPGENHTCHKSLTNSKRAFFSYIMASAWRIYYETNET